MPMVMPSRSSRTTAAAVVRLSKRVSREAARGVLSRPPARNHIITRRIVSFLEGSPSPACPSRPTAARWPGSPSATRTAWRSCTRTAGSRRAQLERRSNRLARAYHELGVRAGDLVTLALPNGSEFFEACLAIWKLGATPQPISSKLPELERRAIVELAQAGAGGGRARRRVRRPAEPAGRLPARPGAPGRDASRCHLASRSAP